MEENKKLISVVIPCYNEEENVQAMTDTVTRIITSELPEYDYEIIFIDNHSQDGTKRIIRHICEEDRHVKAIFNARNFGQMRSPVHGFKQARGDCVIRLNADFQDPPELIPTFVKKWEEGYMIVSAVKTSSKENPFIYFLRSVYYKMMKKMSDVEMIEQFTGFGLYDKSFVQVLRDLHDPIPFIRGVVAELGYKRCEVEYEQPKRRAGKTHNNWYTLYDAAMQSITTYTKLGLRLGVFGGAIVAFFSFIVGLVYLIMKLVNWYGFEAGQAPVVIGIFFFGGVIMLFLGFIGEYIMSMNQRIMNRPLVIEEERLNFDENEDKA
jgi:glycosyltransferase involved in cell wall biosynthesis